MDKQLPDTSEGWLANEQTGGQTAGDTQCKPTTAEFHELSGQLATRQCILKNLLLKQGEFQEKQASQDMKVENINISLKSKGEKEGSLLQRSHSINAMRKEVVGEIEKLRDGAKGCKDQLQQKLKEIIDAKQDVLGKKKALGSTVKDIQSQIAKAKGLSKQLNQLELAIQKEENRVNSKREDKRTVQIKEANVQSICQSIQRQIRETQQAIEKQATYRKELNQTEISIPSKISGIKKQIKDTNFACDQIRFNNKEIQQVNQKLLQDLENASKHLHNVQRTNEEMVKTLREYAKTDSGVMGILERKKIALQ